MKITLARIYDDDQPRGYRVLVDRLWPRGVSKDESNLDKWWKDIAPSDDLRDWFDHDEDKWADFRKKYLHELSEQKDEIKDLLEKVNRKNLILLFGAEDEEHNNAVVLKEYLERLG